MNIAEEIKKLKKERKAVILAHNYCPAEVQDIADFTGDSLELARKATEVDAEVIVFCGVLFMAETAKILNPSRKVLIPDISAGCPMADMISAEEVRALKAANPGAKAVCYVNSTAELKQHSDVCVTSSNAMKIVKKLPNKHIFFIPDENLGRYIAGQVPEKEFIFNEGYCHVHASISAEQVKAAKASHPDAKFLISLYF